MKRIDLYATLKHYHSFINQYNEFKPLKDQLRGEVYTGQLLLKLLHDNQFIHMKEGCTIYTNLYGISKQRNQCLRTTRTHLKKLKQAHIVDHWYSKMTAKGRSSAEIIFNKKIIRYYKKDDVDNMLISGGQVVDNSINGENEGLHSDFV